MGNILYSDYRINNSLGFPLYNVTIMLDHDNQTDILSINTTIDSTIDLENKSIFFSSIAESQNFTINISYSFTLAGGHNISLNLTSAYGAYQQINQNILVFNDVYNISFSYPESVLLRKDFNFSINLSTKINYSLTNFSLSVNFSNNTDVSLISFSHNGSNTSDTSFLISNFNQTDFANITWQLYSRNTSNVSINVTLNTEYGAVYSEQMIISILQIPFNSSFEFISDSATLGEINISLYLLNIVDYNVTNISIALDSSINIDIINSTSAKQNNFSETIAVLYATNISDSIKSLVNVSDNLSYNMSLDSTTHQINFTFNYSLAGLYINNITLALQHNETNTTNVSFLISYLNNGTWENPCNFSASNISLDSRCEITSFIPTSSVSEFNFSFVPLGGSFGNSSIDFIRLELDLYNLSLLNKTVDQKNIYFSTLNASDNINITITINRTADSDDTINATVRSNNAGSLFLSKDLDQISTPSSTSPPGGSSSTGGGSFAGIKLLNISYDYSDYDFLKTLKKYPKLVEFLRIDINKTEEYDNTTLLKDCFNIDRSQDNLSTTLTWMYKCDHPLVSFYFFDYIPKSIIESTDNLKITAPSATITIIEKDPKILYHYSNIEKNKVYSIIYNLTYSGGVGYYEDPVFLVQEKPEEDTLEDPLNNESIGVNVSDVDVVNPNNPEDNTTDNTYSGDKESNVLDLSHLLWLIPLIIILFLLLFPFYIYKHDDKFRYHLKSHIYHMKLLVWLLLVRMGLSKEERRPIPPPILLDMDVRIDSNYTSISTAFIELLYSIQYAFFFIANRFKRSLLFILHIRPKDKMMLEEDLFLLMEQVIMNSDNKSYNALYPRFIDGANQIKILLKTRDRKNKKLREFMSSLLNNATSIMKIYYQIEKVKNAPQSNQSMVEINKKHIDLLDQLQYIRNQSIDLFRFTVSKPAQKSKKEKKQIKIDEKDVEMAEADLFFLIKRVTENPFQETLEERIKEYHHILDTYRSLVRNKGALKAKKLIIRQIYKAHSVLSTAKRNKSKK